MTVLNSGPEQRSVFWTLHRVQNRKLGTTQPRSQGPLYSSLDLTLGTRKLLRDRVSEQSEPRKRQMEQIEKKIIARADPGKKPCSEKMSILPLKKDNGSSLKEFPSLDQQHNPKPGLHIGFAP